jgi:hypothetical protein
VSTLQVRTGMAALLRSVQQDYLTLNREWTVTPEHVLAIQDNLLDTRPGRWGGFSVEGALAPTFVSRIVQLHGPARETRDDGTHDGPALPLGWCRHMLQIIAGFLEKLFALVHLTAPAKPRGTELEVMLRVNGDRPRNVYYTADGVFTTSDYHKMATATGHNLMVPSVLPAPVAALLREFQVGGLQGLHEQINLRLFGSEAATACHR